MSRSCSLGPPARVRWRALRLGDWVERSLCGCWEFPESVGRKPAWAGRLGTRPAGRAPALSIVPAGLARPLRTTIGCLALIAGVCAAAAAGAPGLAAAVEPHWTPPAQLTW